MDRGDRISHQGPRGDERLKPAKEKQLSLAAGAHREGLSRSRVGKRRGARKKKRLVRRIEPISEWRTEIKSRARVKNWKFPRGRPVDTIVP